MLVYLRYLAVLFTVLISGVIMQAMLSFAGAVAGDTATKITSSIQLPEKLIIGYANWNECMGLICS